MSSLDQFAAREFYTVVIGGTILSHIAGFVNAVALGSAFTVTVTHITGNLTRFGAALLKGDLATMGVTTGITLAFMFGSFVSGFSIDSTKFQLGRSYGIALVAEAAILVVSWFLFTLGNVYGALAAAFACGLQNAFATGYSGAVLRTTHMTGITTDIGIVLGQWASRNPRAETWKLKVLGPLWLGYLSGGITGALFYGWMADDAILVPAAVLCLAAIFYLTWAPAREARELLVTAVKKVQTELEMGIRTTVDVMVDGIDTVAHTVQSVTPRIPLPPMPSVSPRLAALLPVGAASLAATSSGNATRQGFHPLDVNSPTGDAVPKPVSPVVVQMVQQVSQRERLDHDINAVFRELELERQRDDADVGNVPRGMEKFVIGDEDDDATSPRK
ncbi:hypothetical protein H9P43_006979 [Blastocladiella emersonii ATCC 22665]|nr:hypothetical protein H9P43_006979 [Blastocladiella emersonii ATCC 22665]